MINYFLDEFRILSQSDADALVCADEIYTWKDYYQISQKFAQGLLSMDLQKKDSVAIISPNCPKYYISIMGTIIAGSIYTGIFHSSNSDEINYILELSESKIIMVQNMEFLKKIDLKKDLILIILFDESPENLSYNNIPVTGFTQFVNNSKDMTLPQICPEDIINYIFTSGTTGRSKCAQRSYEFYSNNSTVIQKTFDFANEKTISYLPSSHSFDLDLILFSHFYHKGTVHFSKNIASSTPDLINFLNEVEPTMFIGVPRIWEKIAGTKEKLMAKCRTPISSGALLSSETEKLLLAKNIQVFTIYGMSETGMISANYSGNVRENSVGKIVSPDLKIANDGEILCKNIFCNYKDNPIANQEFKDQEGWLHTGDIGKIENDFLFIIGRKKEIIITSTGKKINPNNIEEKIRKIDPSLNQIVVIGDNRKFLSLLIFGGNISEKTIEKYNEMANCSSEKIGKYASISENLSIENETLTKSLKLRRTIISEKYKILIDEIYK